jgi:predicted RNA-binding protein YlxR (DUF448 family)
MTLTYSGRSRFSAQAIADEGDIDLNRGYEGDVNWGRNLANTRLNPDISNSTNKRVMRELFREHGVPMPELINDPIACVNRGLKVVGRPDTHMKGRGFWLCRNALDVRRALRGTRRKKAATHFMEFVDSDREYRVHIFKSKSIRVSEKGFTDDTRREYITRQPNRSVRKVRKAAKQAVEALGLDFGAVDILARGDNNEHA